MSITHLAALGLAVLAGSLVILQPPLNAQLAGHLASPLKAALVNFIAGALILLVILAFNRASIPTAAQVSAIPWYLWIVGGALGAFFVTAALWATPRVGVAAYFGVLVSAQLIAALLLDHYGVAGLTERSLTLERMGGVALLIAGAFLVTRG